jgi:RNA ligase (TIGR02306 family)
LQPIENADKIVLAMVLGWQVIVKKDEFNVGDLGIYFSIGSILDKDNKEFDFLEGKPLRTKKMRGVLSQGLMTSLAILQDYNTDSLSVKEGDDVTGIVKVKKWIPEEELAEYDVDKTKAPFPPFIPKTNEERVQGIPQQLKSLDGKNIVITQKFDGTSTTYIVMDNKFMICGRNNLLLKGDTTSYHYFEIAERYKLEEKMLGLKKLMAIQGEIIAGKINGNRHKIKETDFYVFNIYDISAGHYMDWNEVVEITDQLGLKRVTLVYQGPMKPEWMDVKNLLELADKQKYESGAIAEGIVLKSDSKFYPSRFSCKVISNEYLLKYKL